jgi:hypothetical protein
MQLRRARLNRASVAADISPSSDSTAIGGARMPRTSSVVDFTSSRWGRQAESRATYREARAVHLSHATVAFDEVLRLDDHVTCLRYLPSTGGRC